MVKCSIPFIRHISFLNKITIGFLIAVSSVALAIVGYQLSGYEYNHHYQYIKNTLLSESFDLWNAGLDEERSIIAFSFLSEGLQRYVVKNPEKREEAVRILEKCIRLAISEKMRLVPSLNDTATWLYNNLYLTHLSILLASYQHISSTSTYRAFHTAIAYYLAHHLEASKQGNIRSYSQMREIWPADNAATLYSLLVYDRINGTSLHQKAVEKWLNYMAHQGTDKKTGLYISELTGCTEYSNVPRGCSLSWIITYMSSFAPDSGRALWQRYKRQYKIPLVLGCAFREYPPGINLGIDYDTGPIFLGMGSAATGLALPASAKVEDWGTLFQLRCSMMVMDIILTIIPLKEVRQLAGGLLSRAIRLNAL
jgi:hypothetical protein